MKAKGTEKPILMERNFTPSFYRDPIHVGNFQHGKAGAFRLSNMGKRTSLSKRLRFSVFARDNFTCRYCGKQSDVVPLHIDHVIPVCQGGTNDEANLVTSCADCNLGKSGKKISQSVPNETDRLRLAQEFNEQLIDAERVKNIVKLRAEKRQSLVDFWCSVTGRESVDSKTISTVFRYLDQFGEDVVFGWIESGAITCKGDGRAHDINIGKYVSGIRRNHLLKLGVE
jgi:hypothetical protein